MMQSENITEFSAAETENDAQMKQKTKNERVKKVKKIVPKVIMYAILALYTFMIIFPYLIVLSSSFVSDHETTIREGFVLFPQSWAAGDLFESYILIFTRDPFAIGGVSSLLRGFFNSLWQSLIPVVIGLIISGLSAYFLTIVKFPGSRIVYTITIGTMMIPLGAFGMMGYLFYQSIGWVGTPLPIIIPGMFGGASMVFFLSMFYIGLSKEIFEAAKLDGCSTMGIFFKICMPIAKPAFIAQFILGFCGAFNNYSGALLYLNGQKELWPLQLALQKIVAYMSRSGGGYTNVQCGAAVISIIPMLILYLCTQKYFLEGIAVGGGKE